VDGQLNGGRRDRGAVNCPGPGHKMKGAPTSVTRPGCGGPSSHPLPRGAASCPAWRSLVVHGPDARARRRLPRLYRGGRALLAEHLELAAAGDTLSRGAGLDRPLALAPW
jgi:hypothetical protein